VPSTDYISVNVQGVAEAAAGLEALGGELLDFGSSTFIGLNVRRALYDAADDAVLAARHAAPVATGQLRSSIGVDPSTNADGLSARFSADPRNARAQVAFEAEQLFSRRKVRRAKVNYGWFTERGTTRIQAKHWFEQSVAPVLKLGEERVLEALRIGVQQALHAKSYFLPTL
jgi:hypothetical protein